MNPLRQLGMESWIILMQVTRKVYSTSTEARMLARRSRSSISLLLSLLQNHEPMAVTKFNTSKSSRL